MDPIFRWIEDSALAMWLIGSDSILAYPTVLTIHVIGMGFVAGINLLFALRLLGWLAEVPISALERLIPLFWLMLGLSIFSGLLLVIGYPTKALTNPIFYVKMLCLVLGLLVLRKMRRLDPAKASNEASPSNARPIALASLVLWVGVITAGRLLAYTYTRLLVDF